MPHVLQRDGVRIIAFNKSAHTSIVNAFCTDRGVEIARGQNAAATKGKKVLRGAGITSIVGEVLRGRANERIHWPTPLFTFVFVRHPLARVVSAWNHLCRIRGKNKELYYRFRILGFVADMTFPKFAAQLLTLDHTTIDDEHLRGQMQQFNETLTKEDRHNDEIRRDAQVIRVENLDTEWADMVAETEVSCTDQIPTFNDNDSKVALRVFERDYHLATSLISFYKADYTAWVNRSCHV